jgi:Flp pilus assembly pilin Flp
MSLDILPIVSILDVCIIRVDYPHRTKMHKWIRGFCPETEAGQLLAGTQTSSGALLFPRRKQAHDLRGSQMLHRLLKDESGQTMLEYIVIVAFVVIMAIVGFRLVKRIVSSSIQRASRSIEGDHRLHGHSDW